MPKQNRSGQDFSGKGLPCAQCSALLFDYLSELLDDKMNAQIEGHLSTCPECRKELEEIRAMLAVLESAEEVPLPVGYAASLHEKLVDVSKEIRGELAPPETESLLQKLGSRFRDFVVHTNWRVAAPAMLAAVLVVSVFSTGLYRTFRDSDDVLDRGGVTTPAVQTTRSPQVSVTPAPEQSQAAVSVRTDQPETAGTDGAEPAGKALPAKTDSVRQGQDAGTNEAPSRDRSTGQNQTQNGTASSVSSTAAPNQNRQQSEEEQEAPAVQNSVPAAQPVKGSDVSQYKKPDGAPSPAPVKQESASGRSADPDEAAAPEAYSMPVAADVEAGEDGGEPMTGRGEQPPSNNSLQSSAPASEGGGGSVNGQAAKNPVYTLSAPDLKALLQGWGESGSAKELTMSRDEFSSFRGYVSRNGGTLSQVESGDGDTVIIRVSR